MMVQKTLDTAVKSLQNVFAAKMVSLLRSW